MAGQGQIVPQGGGLLLSWQAPGLPAFSLLFTAAEERQATVALLLLRLHAAVHAGDEAAMQQLIATLQVRRLQAPLPCRPFKHLCRPCTAHGWRPPPCSAGTRRRGRRADRCGNC